MKRQNRRQFTQTLAGAAGALALAGCAAPSAAPTAAPPAASPATASAPASTGAPAPSTTAVVSAPAAAPAGQPKLGGTLRYAHPADIFDFDPTQLPSGNWPIFFTVFDTLVRYDDQHKLTPQLAESWEFTNGGKSLVMKLRQGVTFHTGRAFTADDVVFSLKRFQDAKVGANMRSLALFVKDVKANDKYTVTFQMDKPNAAIMDLFDLLFIMDKNSMADVKTKAVGTGPFMLKSWIPGDHATFVKNPHYWKSGKPYLDSIEILTYPDYNTLTVNAETGAVHIAERISPKDLKRLQSNTSVDVILAAQGATFNDVLMNVTKPPFNNVKVRAAIDTAINRDRFAELYDAGFTKGGCLPFPKGSLGYFDDLASKCVFDLEKAGAMLKSAGVSTVDANVLISSQGYLPGSNILGQIMQADMKKIGINLNLQDLAQAQARPELFGKKYQMACHTYGRANKDPVTMFGGAVVWFTSCSKNITGFCSDEFTKLVDAAATTIDPAKRTPILHDLIAYVLDQHFTLAIAPGFIGYVKQKKVQGFQTNLDGMAIFENTWLS